MSKVFLALSGGVDSTAAALLLKRQGYTVVGFFMQHPWQAKNDNANEAEQIALRLGIDFHRMDLAEAFQNIVDYFTDEYFQGRTPNPCAFCNKTVKFGVMFEEMNRRGCDFLATGHYIRRRSHNDWLGDDSSSLDCFSLEFDPEFPAICRGKDAGKDQSYIMFGVERAKLSRLLFPVGDYEKSRIRELVSEAGFDFSGKSESQEICFVPDQEHVSFIHRQRPGMNTAGNLVTTEGKVIVSHDGFEQFTIGQRKGMKIGLGDRRYVVRIDAKTHDVVIGCREDLKREELTASQTHWLIPTPKQPFRAQVKIRYRSPATPAWVIPFENHRMTIKFDEPREAIAPGQVAACYLGTRIIGGGWIDS